MLKSNLQSDDSCRNDNLTGPVYTPNENSAQEAKDKMHDHITRLAIAAVNDETSMTELVTRLCDSSIDTSLTALASHSFDRCWHEQIYDGKNQLERKMRSAMLAQIHSGKKAGQHRTASYYWCEYKDGLYGPCEIVKEENFDF